MFPLPTLLPTLIFRFPPNSPPSIYCSSFQPRAHLFQFSQTTTHILGRAICYFAFFCFGLCGVSCSYRKQTRRCNTVPSSVFLALPCIALALLVCPALPWPAVACRGSACPTLLCLALPCRDLQCPTMLCRVGQCHAVQCYPRPDRTGPARPCRSMLDRAVPYRVLPCSKENVYKAYHTQGNVTGTDYLVHDDSVHSITF